MTTLTLTNGPWQITPHETDRLLNLLHYDTLVAQVPMDGARVYGCGESGIIADLRWRVENDWLYCNRCLRLPERMSACIQVRDVLRWRGEGILDWHRSWWHTESIVVTPVELFAGVRAMAPMRAHLLPAILYDGNAGAVPERVVPRLAWGTKSICKLNFGPAAESFSRAGWAEEKVMPLPSSAAKT